MPTYVAMWSGPRNISTALMRSFENRSDCFVSDEPFYSFFLHKTGLNHPLRNEIIQSGRTNYKQITAYITGAIPSSKNIWYQKHMAHHLSLNSDIEWVKKMTNCILIRHPKDVISSYVKKNELKSIDQLGYPQQIQIYNFLCKETKSIPIIVDAKDLLEDPKSILIKICSSIGIKFSSTMLSWPKGPRKTDGIWGKYWYKKVEQSTGFKSYTKTSPKIDTSYMDLYDQCMEHFNILYNLRIR